MSLKVYHYGFGTKVKFSKSLCSVTVKRGRIVPGGWATSRVARRRSGPSSPKFAISPRTFVVAHLERRPAARCATTIIRGEMANFGEEGPLCRRAAHPSSDRFTM